VCGSPAGGGSDDDTVHRYMVPICALLHRALVETAQRCKVSLCSLVGELLGQAIAAESGDNA